MTKLYINAVSCRRGGGLRDLMHTLPLLDAELAPYGWQTHTWVVDRGREVLNQTGYDSSRVHDVATTAAWKRATWEWQTFPRIVRQSSPAVVFQFSNFAVRRMPCPQLVMLRSSAYFSPTYRTLSQPGPYSKLRYWAGRCVSKRTLSVADCVCCPSQALRDEVAQRFRDQVDDLIVAPLGCEPPASVATTPGAVAPERLSFLPREARTSIGAALKSQREVVLHVSHYSVQKNLGDLLQAIDRLRAKGRNVLLVTTAEVSKNYRSKTQRTRQEAALACNLAATGHLVETGPVTPREVWSLYALADVFAFTSSVESFGHPLLEAQCMHVPVVAADTPVHREIAGAGARYYPLGEVQELIKQIVLLLDNRRLSQELVENARVNAQRYTWQRHVDKLVKCILELACDWKERPAGSASPSRAQELPHV